MTDNERATCAALAGLLRAFMVLAIWGIALTCISALVLALTLRSLSTTAAMGLGAVVILGVRETQPAQTTTRSLDNRVQGTRQLMQRHAIVVACQSAMFLLALMTQDLS